MRRLTSSSAVAITALATLALHAIASAEPMERSPEAAEGELCMADASQVARPRVR
jgi:hypothetical protein